MSRSKSLLKLETKETEKYVEEYTPLFSDVFLEKCVDEVTEKCVTEKVAKNLQPAHGNVRFRPFFATIKLKTDI